MKQKLFEVIRKFMAAADKDGKTILSKLVAVEGDKLNEEELLGNLVTLFLAGVDTTSNTLAWVMHHLAQSSELQDRLYAEVDSIAPHGVLDPEHLDRLELVSAVWAQGLRLNGAAPFLAFTNLEEFEIAGRTVPVGTTMLTLNRQLMNKLPQSTTFGQDFSAFRPDRWLGPENVLKNRPDVVSLAFGHGPRSCVGRRVPDCEARLVIAEIIRAFRLSTNQSDLREKTSFTQEAAENIMVTAVARN